MNRSMLAVTQAAQEFANVSSAIAPLLLTLSANAEQAYERRLAEQQQVLRALEARAHGFGDPPSNDDAFTALDASTADWSDAVWTRFKPSPAASGIPRLTRCGIFIRDVTVRAGSDSQRISVPAYLPIIARGGTVIIGEGKDLDAARDALQSMLVRLIASLSPGALRLTLIDQLGVGNNFALLTPFHEAIRGSMVWHDSKQIGHALESLIEHMAMVTQKYLTTEFENIEAYNDSQGVVDQPYRVLAIANFPAGFDRHTAEQVVSIAQNGPRSGVYLILSIDRKQPMPHGFRLEDLTRFCTVLEGTMKSGFLWRPNVHGWPEAAARWATDVLERGRVTLDERPAVKIVEEIARSTAQGAIDRKGVKVSFSQLAPKQLWNETTARGISTPIGRAGNKDQIFALSVGADAVHHAIIGGRTGSGKSVLIKGLITSLCERYSPAELELYLVDFKGGVEFRVFSDLPHARVIALESEREFGLSVLEGLIREKTARERIFKQNEVNDLPSYRERGGTMPRILLIVDEFQVFFEASDRIGMRARAALDDLARKGRSFGIHVVLASQSISAAAGSELDQATLNQFGLRIALAMNESDATRILSRENDAAKFITRAGEAIFNAQNGLPGGNVLFQVAYVSDRDVAAHVRTIRNHAEQQGVERKPFLFEGNRPAAIRDNHELTALASNPPAAAPRAIPVYLGEPAAIQDAHTAYRMRRQAGDNLLMVGQHEETLFSIFVTAVASWAAQQPRSSAHITVFNLANDDDEMVRAHIDVLKRLPQNVRIGRNAAVVPWLDELSADLDLRRGDEESETPRPRTLVAIYGIQRARDLVREGYSGSAATKKLTRLIQDGPEAGIAFIVAADMYANLLRVLEAKDLTNFGGRVAVMGGDAGKILGDHSSGFKVRENYGLLYEPDKPDVLHKFRTYGLAQTQWMAQYLAKGHESCHE